MNSFRVVYSDTAIAELKNIRRYIARNLQNPESACEWTEYIMSSAETLSVFPKRHPVRGKDSHGNDMRIFPVGSYAIIYSVDDTNRIVNISRIIYSRRNLDSLI